MKALGAAVVLIVIAQLGADSADAKRAPLPEFEVCNQAGETRYLATRNYSGRGHYTSRGWTAVKPNKCATLRADTIYIRGGKIPAQVDKKRTAKGCITAQKVFSVVARDKTLAAECGKARGEIVEFHAPRPKTKKVVLE